LSIHFFLSFSVRKKTPNCLYDFFGEKGRDFFIVRVLETQFLRLLEKDIAVC